MARLRPTHLFVLLLIAIPCSGHLLQNPKTAVATSDISDCVCVQTPGIEPYVMARYNHSKFLQKQRALAALQLVLCRCNFCVHLPAHNITRKTGIPLEKALAHLSTDMHGPAFPYEAGPGWDPLPHRRPYTWELPAGHAQQEQQEQQQQQQYSDDDMQDRTDDTADPAPNCSSPANNPPAHSHPPGSTSCCDGQNRTSNTGSVDPNIERLRKQQPGADGARLKLRKKTAWSGYDKAAFDAAPAVLQERVLRACLSSVRCKVNASTGQPEPDFAAHLETSRELLLDCAEAVNWAVAALIPHTFTQTLTLLDYKEQLPFFLRDGGLWEYDTCPGCYDFFRGETQYDTECRHCLKDKNIHVPRTKQHTFCYSSIRTHIRRIFANAILAEAMGSWSARRTTDGTINDTCDADVYLRLWNEMGPEIRNAVVSIYFDPFQPFKANAKYSCAPIMLVIQNLPAHLRWKHCAAHLCGIQEGENRPNCKVNRRAMFKLVCEELQYLELVPVQVQDAHMGDSPSIKVRLACILSDYRGLQELTGMLGSPSHFSCFKCWVSGFLAGAGKRLFTNHYTFLPLDHPMRSTQFGLCGKHNYSKQIRTGKEEPCLFRSQTELVKNKPLPFSDSLVAGERSCTRDASAPVEDPLPGEESCIFWWLRYMNLRESLAYDAMHTMAGNVKTVFFTMMGILPVKPNAVVLQYDEQVNGRPISLMRLSATALLRMRSVFSQMAAFVKDGGRLRHIMDKGHKTKMHTYIQVCGTMGAYAVWSASASGTESGRLGQNQAMAIIGLLQAMGELWNHSINRADIGSLELRMLVAICNSEMFLSSQLCDIKMHNLTHCAEAILALGPMYLWSMFPAENMWSWLQRTVRNKARPEACMMNSYHDKQAIDLKYLKSAEAKPYRDPRDYMNFPDKVSYEMKGQITTKATLEDREALAIYYLESIPALSALWAQAVHLFVETHSRREIDTAGIVRVGGGYKFQTDRLKYLFFTRKFSGNVSDAVGRPLTRAEQAVTLNNIVQIKSEIAKSTALQLGPVYFKPKPKTPPAVNSMQPFMMSRKGNTAATAVPRFGVFGGALQHTGPDGKQRMFISGQWLKASTQLHHPIIRAPLALRVYDTAMPKLCLAQDIAPHLCFGAHDLLPHTRRWIMLTEKNWSCLGLLGFQKIR